MAGIVVYGAGGHAKVVIDAIEQRGGFSTIIPADDNPGLQGLSLCGYPVLGGRTALLTLPEPRPEALAAIGDNAKRMAVLDWLQSQGFPIATVIHPDARIGRGVRIDAGAFLAAGVVVNVDAVLGQGVIVNTGATVDHDCVIGEGVHIAPGCHLCGNVAVGARSLLGAGCVVVPGVCIGADVVVGAGSTVLSDVPDGGRVAGSPARSLV
jgi:sugar O-acyltransferase (sialic acid O-acetyltransferase NeuD family)